MRASIISIERSHCILTDNETSNGTTPTQINPNNCNSNTYMTHTNPRIHVRAQQQSTIKSNNNLSNETHPILLHDISIVFYQQIEDFFISLSCCIHQSCPFPLHQHDHVTLTQSSTFKQLTMLVTQVLFTSAPVFKRRSTMALFFLSHAIIRKVLCYFETSDMHFVSLALDQCTYPENNSIHWSTLFQQLLCSLEIIFRNSITQLPIRTTRKFATRLDSTFSPMETLRAVSVQQSVHVALVNESTPEMV